MSISAQILEKVYRPFSPLETSMSRKRPRELPIPWNTAKSHRCAGTFGSLTQIGSLVMIVVVGSKSGNQGVRNNPAESQNRGPSVNAFW